MTKAGSTEPELVARLEAVTHRYGATAALDDVTLPIPAARTVGLIGPDGVGKSTLLALVAGARRIQTGRVIALQGDMANARHRTAVSARVAYVPQGLGTNLYPDLSVVENIDFFGRLYGQSAAERRRRIDELLHSTGLAPFPDRRAGILSGGMRQKLGLCCALIHDPDLLILDEPTTGIDPLSRRQFWDLIGRIRDRRQTISVLVATAYMEEAEDFDWLVMMDAGRVLATGSPTTLKSRSASTSLENVFVDLLPPEKHRVQRAPTITAPALRGDGPAIEARDLTRRFGDFTAVDHVSFRIERGEIFGFVGPNGCGKTTTMKMLTGLLPPTAGESRLFGRTATAGAMAIRKRIGYMSQSFSLFSELTVRQNLELHARLFQLPADRIAARVAELVERFGLAPVIDDQAEKLPLGIRQRLSLAVAVAHQPEILILDEPTSGVDPVARDGFWDLLLDLSRNQGVSIFVSTHFMNEAARCDRVALMDAGRLLACDSPRALIESRGARNLEDAFIAYLEDVRGNVGAVADRPGAAADRPGWPDHAWFDIRRLWAYARREAIELSRDPIRLAFSFLAPMLLLVIFGYGISMDVERLAYAALDRDRTPESRTYLEVFSSSRYFDERKPVTSYAELDHRLLTGELTLAIEIPPNFGKDIKVGRPTEVGIWIDGSYTFRAETTRGYVAGANQRYLSDLALLSTGRSVQLLPADVETRFRYNQDFKSVFAIVPGVFALLLAFIPSVLTAVGVVREKEMGSITNLYVTPVTRLEFLLGKQLPYVAISLINFISLVGLSLVIFGIPLKGSFLALFAGALLYVMATTGFGLLVSSFTKTQIAALFAALILTLLPAWLFSGLIRPISSLSGGGKLMGQLFPAAYFHKISVGTFTKSLGFADLLVNYIALSAFVVFFLLVCLALLRKQGV